MKRRAFNIAAGMSLLLFGATLALSLGLVRQIHLNWGNPRSTRYVFTFDGGLSFKTERGLVQQTDPLPSLRFYVGSHNESHSEFAGIAHSRATLRMFGPNGVPLPKVYCNYEEISLSAAWLLFLSGLLPLTWLMIWVYGPRTPGSRQSLCPACGYDLRATPERCPECGATIDKSSEVMS